jgi:hypothetical protein
VNARFGEPSKGLQACSRLLIIRFSHSTSSRGKAPRNPLPRGAARHHPVSNASLTLGGAGLANEQLAAPVRGKLATTEEGPSGSFRGALS